MKRKILITGAHGFVGRNLVLHFTKKGYEVIAFSHKELDITDKSAVFKRMEKIKPAVVINAAVYGAMHYQKDDQKIYKVNHQGLVNLVDCSIKLKIPLLIHTGSSSEYGFKNTPMKETMRCLPNSAYSDSKLLATKYCRLKKGLGTKMVILRLFSVYGYYEPKQRLMPQIIINASHNQEIKMSDPKNVRDFVFIEDVCNAYDAVVNKSDKIKSGEIFNVGSGMQHTLKEVIEIYRKINPKIKVSWKNELGRDERDAATCWQADISKIKKKLEWRAQFSLYQGLGAMTKWIKRNVELYE